MKRVSAAVAGAAMLLSACNQNTAPGNDREAQLDPVLTPAPAASAADALAGIATSAIQPVPLTSADLAGLGGLGGKCAFRFTAVSFPAFVYDAARGTIKLNGTLITLPATSEGRFAEAGLQVLVRPIETDFDSGGRRKAEMIVQLPDAPDELGFRGYEVCAQQL
ncbi:hypothetical protein RM533_12580 [Croceicoccus sp. F390]|uniref:DUF6692 domain-containing protein n=1 Tax=Croceicoccus esteveae TaxID=3075597 RepID=A0ABU2ZN52_9SPHN|nr:DUF6692 family protein [Croceicoccus sp. F390]MDT0577004.1 hypothetical protein [Croceicoccus sp. F390]